MKQFSQDQLLKFLNTGSISKSNDLKDKPDYMIFEVKGFDPETLRLAVSRNCNTTYWLIIFKHKNAWVSCRSSDDNPISHLNTNTFWCDELESLTGGFDTPSEWLNELLIQHNNSLQ